MVVAEGETEIKREIDIFKEKFSLSGNLFRALIIKLKDFYYHKMYIPEYAKEDVIDKFKKESYALGNTNRALILGIENDWFIYGFDDKDSFKELKLNSNDELAKKPEEDDIKDRNKFIKILKEKLGRTQFENNRIVYYYDNNGLFKELKLVTKEKAKELDEEEFIKKLALKLGHTYDVKNPFKEIKLDSNDELIKELEERKPRFKNKFIKKIAKKLGYTISNTIPITNKMLPKNSPNIIFKIPYKQLIEHIQYSTIKQLKQAIWNRKTLMKKMEFNRKFCSNPTELAFLDFFLWFGNQPEKQRILFNRCNSDRSEEEVQESIKNLRKTIVRRLKPINIPLNFNTNRLKTIFKDHSSITSEFINDLAKSSEFLLVNMGNFSLYHNFFPHEEFSYYHSPFPWNKFKSKKELYNNLGIRPRDIKSHKMTLLFNQTRMLYPNTVSIRCPNKTELYSKRFRFVKKV